MVFLILHHNREQCQDRTNGRAKTLRHAPTQDICTSTPTLADSQRRITSHLLANDLFPDLSQSVKETKPLINPYTEHRLWACVVLLCYLYYLSHSIIKNQAVRTPSHTNTTHLVGIEPGAGNCCDSILCFLKLYPRLFPAVERQCLKLHDGRKVGPYWHWFHTWLRQWQLN